LSKKHNSKAYYPPALWKIFAGLICALFTFIFIMYLFSSTIRPAAESGNEVDNLHKISAEEILKFEADRKFADKINQRPRFLSLFLKRFTNVQITFSNKMGVVKKKI
jgi:hypothetical protein